MDKLGDKAKAGQRADVYNYNLDHVYCSDNSNYRDQMTNLNLASTVSDMKTLRKENKQLQAMLLLHLDLIQEQSNQLIAKDKQLLQLREENDRLRSKSERSAAIERQQKFNKHSKILNTSGGSPTIDTYFSSESRGSHRTQTESVLSNTKENVKMTRNTSVPCDIEKQSSIETRNGQILLQQKTIKTEPIVASMEQIKVNNIAIQAKERPNLISPTSTIAGEKCYSIKYQKISSNANYVSNDKGKLINKIILQRKRSSNGEKVFVRTKSVDLNIKRVDTDKWITVKPVKSEQDDERDDLSEAHIVERETPPPPPPPPTSLLLSNVAAKKSTNINITIPNSPNNSNNSNSSNSPNSLYSVNSSNVSQSTAKCRKLSEIDSVPENGHETVVKDTPTEAPGAVALQTEELEELDLSEYGFKDSESEQCVSVTNVMEASVFDRTTSGYPIKSPLSCVLSPADSSIPPTSPKPMQNSSVVMYGSTLLYPNTKRIIAHRNSYITTNKQYKTREWQLDEIEVETKQMITDEINEKEEDDDANLELPKWRTWEMSSNREAPAPREWEDLSDDTFSKRHARFLLDERKRKKWDVQRIREQRTIERLKRRHYKEEVPTKDDIELFSFFPSADQLKSIQISDDLPVSAFGELVPLLPISEFVLPWHTAYGVPQNLMPDTVSLVAADFKQLTGTITFNSDTVVSNVSSIVFLPKKRIGRSKFAVQIMSNLIIPKRE